MYEQDRKYYRTSKVFINVNIVNGQVYYANVHTLNSCIIIIIITTSDVDKFKYLQSHLQRYQSAGSQYGSHEEPAIEKINK